MAGYAKVPRNHLGNVAFPFTITPWYVASVVQWPIKLQDAYRWRRRAQPMCDVMVHFNPFVSVGGTPHNSARVQMDAEGYHIRRGHNNSVCRFNTGLSAQIDAVRTVCLSDDAEWARYKAAQSVGLSDAEVASIQRAIDYADEWERRGCVAPDVLGLEHVASFDVTKGKKVTARRVAQAETDATLDLVPFTFPRQDTRRRIYWGSDGPYIKAGRRRVPFDAALTCEVLGVATKFYAFDVDA